MPPQKTSPPPLDFIDSPAPSQNDAGLADTAISWGGGNSPMQHWLTMALLAAALAAPLRADDDGNMRQDDRIDFDKTHSVVFHDQGRTESHGDIYYGKTPIIISRAGDKITTITLGADIQARYPVSSQAYCVQFKDQNRVWVVSRIRNHQDGAILLNVQTGKIEKAYYGWDFFVSPDGARVAFGFSDDGDHSSIFIDDTMIYPVLDVPMAKSSPSGMTATDGAPHKSKIPAGTEYGSMTGDFRWSATGVEFVTCAKDAKGREFFTLNAFEFGKNGFTRKPPRKITEEEFEAYGKTIRKNGAYESPMINDSAEEDVK